MTTADICGICEYLLEKQDENRIKVNILKLMKLLYYAQGYSLAIRGERLFDEKIQAWKNGPVIPEVYERYKGSSRNSTHRHLALKRLHCRDNGVSKGIARDIAKVLDRVLEDKGYFSGKHLSHQTHHEPPWRKTYNPHQKNENKCISTDLMREYFLNSHEIRAFHLGNESINPYLKHLRKTYRIDFRPLDEMLQDLKRSRS